MNTAKITFNTDQATKEMTSELFRGLGLDMTTALNIFLRKCLEEQGIPFKVGYETPNRETLEAIAEMEEMKEHPENYKTYSNIEDFKKAVHE